MSADFVGVPGCLHDVLGHNLKAIGLLRALATCAAPEHRDPGAEGWWDLESVTVLGFSISRPRPVRWGARNRFRTCIGCTARRRVFDKSTWNTLLPGYSNDLQQRSRLGRMSARAGASTSPVRVAKATLSNDYASVLAQLKQMIGDSRHRALSILNRELVWLYWQIGRIIVRQQEQARWGDTVVERLSLDLRGAFPDMKGLSRDNLFRMQQFYLGCRRTDGWLAAQGRLGDAAVGTLPRLSAASIGVGTLSRQADVEDAIVSGLSAELAYPGLASAVLDLSWSHHYSILSGVDRPDEPLLLRSHGRS
jgi:hypothetical protein